MQNPDGTFLKSCHLAHDTEQQILLICRVDYVSKQT